MQAQNTTSSGYESHFVSGLGGRDARNSYPPFPLPVLPAHVPASFRRRIRNPTHLAPACRTFTRTDGPHGFLATHMLSNTGIRDVALGAFVKGTAPDLQFLQELRTRKCIDENCFAFTELFDANGSDLPGQVCIR